MTKLLEIMQKGFSFDSWQAINSKLQISFAVKRLEGVDYIQFKFQDASQVDEGNQTKEVLNFEFTASSPNFPFVF